MAELRADCGREARADVGEDHEWQPHADCSTLPCTPDLCVGGPCCQREVAELGEFAP